MDISPTTLAMAGFAVPATIAVVDKFLPALHEVRQASDPATRLNVRMGELAAGGWMLGVAGYLAWATGSKHPLFLAGAGLAFLAAVYETALSSKAAQIPGKGADDGPSSTSAAPAGAGTGA